MASTSCPEMKFRVWDFTPDGKLHATDKEFSVSLDEAKKRDPYTTSIQTTDIIEAFFKKVFQMKNNGFSIRTDDGHMKSLTIYWRGDTWRLIRVV